jgi:hypothetical protein
MPFPNIMVLWNLNHQLQSRLRIEREHPKMTRFVITVNPPPPINTSLFVHASFFAICSSSISRTAKEMIAREESPVQDGALGEHVLSLWHSFAMPRV